tara:strand:+ start:403 stop:1050 length:648 start_codon:yes stop_codon:yes gene_type:complete
MKKIHFLSYFLLTTIILLDSCANKNNKSADQIIAQEEKNPKKEKLTNNNQRFTIDIDNTVVEWYGKKTAGSHNGIIKMQKGSLIMSEDGDIVTGKFNIDMNSINCTDLTGNKKTSIEEHLKDDDFFSTEKYPLASFIIKKVDAKKIYGILNIKGISQKISFPYSKLNDYQYKAEINIDRTLFDIKYKSKTIFPDLGDNFIHDNFVIKLNPLSISK